MEVAASDEHVDHILFAVKGRQVSNSAHRRRPKVDEADESKEVKAERLASRLTEKRNCFFRTLSRGEWLCNRIKPSKRRSASRR
jgi:hypothetical protein